jgi:hypothetical protein
MVKIIAVHMMLSSQCYLKSDLLTQSFGPEDSRKSINTISNHYLPVSKKNLMDRPVLKLPEILLEIRELSLKDSVDYIIHLPGS